MGAPAMKRRNPNIDLNKAGIEEMFNAIPGVYGRSREPVLWWFQFGPYTGTNVFVWGGRLEDGLEIAAGWLADNAPGHLMEHGSEVLPSSSSCSLIRSASSSWAEWEEALKDQEQWAYDVEQEAFADLTYTEAGYLTSYEWYVNELNSGDELYGEVWEATIDELSEQGDLDEDDLERVNEYAEKLGIDAEWEPED